jgi:hypothetical protein
VADAGGLFTETDVEAVLEELFGLFPRELAYTEKTSDTSITATTEATSNTVVTAGAVVLDGSTRIAVTVFSPEIVTPADVGLAAVLFGAQDGGAAASLGFFGSMNAGTSGAETTVLSATYTATRFLTPAAGSWVYSYRAFVGSGTGTIRGGAGGVAAYVPAFIRVVKAPSA